VLLLSNTLCAAREGKKKREQKTRHTARDVPGNKAQRMKEGKEKKLKQRERAQAQVRHAQATAFGMVHWQHQISALEE